VEPRANMTGVRGGWCTGTCLKTALWIFRFTKKNLFHENLIKRFKSTNFKFTKMLRIRFTVVVELLER
jgi:hypothetical protein